MPENPLEVTLESIGLSLDQMDSYMISIRTGIGDFDRQICICGHPMARHERSGEFSSCTVSKSWCACSSPLPVLEAERIKPFRFASTGFGQKHALSKGVYAMQRQGHTASWLIDPMCFKCKAEDVQIQPAPLSKTKKIIDRSGYTNVLLCMPCIEEVGCVYYY